MVTRSGCASAVPAGRALPVNICISRHRLHHFQAIRRRAGPANASVSPPRHALCAGRAIMLVDVVREGVAGLARHPLDDSTPAGATVARVKFSRQRTVCRAGEEAGTGTRPVPLRLHRQRGRRLPAAHPQTRSFAMSRRGSASAIRDRQRDEAGVLTLLHPQQHGALAVLLALGDGLADIARASTPTCRRLPGSRRRWQSHVRRRRREESTPVTTTPSRAGARDADGRRQASGRACRNRRRCSSLVVGVALAPALAVRQFAERQRNGLLRALVQDRQLDRRCFGASAPIFLARSRASFTSRR